MSAPDRNTSRIAGDLKTAADATTPREIDLDAVLGASRARRRARRTAIIGGAGAAAAVLVAGGLVFGTPGVGLFTSTTADSSSESGAIAESVPEAPRDAAQGGANEFQAAAGIANRCGSPVIDATDASAAPLTAALVVPARVEPGASVAAAVVLTNHTDATVVGEVRSAPSLAVDEDGIVVWRTGDPIAVTAQPVELEPGDSVTLSGSFETRRCDLDDEPLGTTESDLPPLDAGGYAVSAVVEFAAAGFGATVAIVSPAAEVAVG